MLDGRKGTGYILLELLEKSTSNTAACHHFPHLLSQVIITSSELGPLPVFIPSVVRVFDDVVHPPPICGGQTC